MQRYVDETWVPLESVDMAQNNTYQGYQDAEGTVDYVFNINRPEVDLTQAWRIRILGHRSVIADKE